jgi:cytoskeletal protein RodZ
MDSEKTILKGPCVSIGERLKAARERKNLEIGQVQKQTRIHSSAYVKSFLRKYSQYLNLDSEELAKEYSINHPERPDAGEAKVGAKDFKRDDALIKFIYVVGIALLLIASLSIAAILVRKVSSSFCAKRQTVRETSTIPSRSKTKAVKAPRRAVEAPVKTAVAAKLAASKKAQKDIEEISIPQGEKLKVVLKVKQPCLIGVKEDGELRFKRVVPKGAQESFTANDRIEIYTAKAEAMEIILNGKTLGSPGRGVIKNIEISRKGIRIR